jgi:hypothetical protein
MYKCPTATLNKTRNLPFFLQVDKSNPQLLVIEREVIRIRTQRPSTLLINEKRLNYKKLPNSRILSCEIAILVQTEPICYNEKHSETY